MRNTASGNTAPKVPSFNVVYFFPGAIEGKTEWAIFPSFSSSSSSLIDGVVGDFRSSSAKLFSPSFPGYLTLNANQRARRRRRQRHLPWP
jgi:hypothetical protein